MSVNFLGTVCLYGGPCLEIRPCVYKAEEEQTCSRKE